VTENSLFVTFKAETCRGALPVLARVKVLVDFWPTTTVWKLNELADTERPLTVFWVTPAQPTETNEIKSRIVAKDGLRRNERIELNTSNTRANPLA
jgi:hypothetical protein